MKSLDSKELSRATRAAYVCVKLSAISVRKSAEMTIRRACEVHGIKVCGHFDDALGKCAPQERQANLAQHAIGEEPSLGGK